MSSAQGSVVYEKTHQISVFLRGDIASERVILITIVEYDRYLRVKLRDVNEYSFNYTVIIDDDYFRRLKHEQSLDIDYDDLKSQLVELLQKTVTREMLVRVEADEKSCRIIFFEKSKIKSLIFLTLDLESTNQRDVIREMEQSISQLKGDKQNLGAQIVTLQRQLLENNSLLKTVKTANATLQNAFVEDLKTIENAVTNQMGVVETCVLNKLGQLTGKQSHLLRDLDVVKTENRLQRESSARLMQSMQNLRLENEKNCATIEELNSEMQNLNKLRTKAERSAYELKLELGGKEETIEELQRQNAEFKNDLTEATIIITQKTKTHNELAKDLVQANQMLVNFNNHYDVLAKECDRLKDELQQRDSIINDQKNAVTKIFQEFEKYKKEFSADLFKRLEHELAVSMRKNEELEKLNREAAKLNGVLTRKIAGGDTFNGVWMPNKV